METAGRAVRIERRGPVAELVLLGPSRGNALGPDFWREMPPAIAALDADPEVRVILLRGDNGHFTYGLDLPGMMAEMAPIITGQNMAAERTALLEMIGRMQGASEGLARTKKPVIAAISGWCIGGGMHLVAACDFRLCSADARFSLREVKLAITPDLGALQRLPRIIGEGATRELAYTGRDIDASRALAIGLVNEVFPSPDALLAGAREIAARIADNPPIVVQGCKQVLEYCADKSVEDGLRFVAVWNAAFLQSLDLGEAFAAFAERRPPRFSGK